MKTEGSLELAASKAGMDAKTARKYRRVGRLPSELESAERWRTRPDPFSGVWEAVREGLQYLRILELAARDSESRVDEALRTLLQQSAGPVSAESVESMLAVATRANPRDVEISAIDLSLFDRLYTEVVQ